MPVKQIRAMSALEALANVAVGYLLALATQILAFPLFGIAITLRQLHLRRATPRFRIRSARAAPGTRQSLLLVERFRFRRSGTHARIRVRGVAT
jgi:hypothetical protein